MTKLEQAILFSKYVYVDSYEKIMERDEYTEYERDIIAQEYFLSSLAGQKCFYEGSHAPEDSSPFMLKCLIMRAKQIAPLPDPLLGIVIDDN